MSSAQHTFYGPIMRVGVSYFVYGEKINVYSGTDPIHQEFIDAGLEYTRSVLDITSALPFYKLYPSKAYRDYKNTVKRMQRAGSYAACFFNGQDSINTYRKTNPSSSI